MDLETKNFASITGNLAALSLIVSQALVSPPIKQTRKTLEGCCATSCWPLKSS